MKKALKITLIISSLAALAALCIWLIPIILSLREPENRLRFVEFIDSIGIWGVILMLVIQVLQIVIVIIPGEPIELLMGFMYGTIGGLALTLIGIIIGTFLVFFAVKRFGKKFAEKFINSEKLSKLDFLKNPAKRDPLIFLLFLIPGTPKDALTYFAPFTGIRFIRFLLLSTLARIPSVVSSTLIGASVSEGEFRKSIILFALTGVLGLAGIIINNHLSAKQHNKD